MRTTVSSVTPERYSVFYEVKVRTKGFEIYLIEADSVHEAQDNWFEGSMIHSEVLDTEVMRVDEVKD